MKSKKKTPEKQFEAAQDQLTGAVHDALAKYDETVAVFEGNKDWETRSWCEPMMILQDAIWIHYRWGMDHSNTKNMLQNYFDHVVKNDKEAYNTELCLRHQNDNGEWVCPECGESSCIEEATDVKGEVL